MLKNNKTPIPDDARVAEFWLFAILGAALVALVGSIIFSHLYEGRLP